MKILDLSLNVGSNTFSDLSGFNTSISKVGTFIKTIPMCSGSESSILLSPSNSLTIDNVPIGVRSHEAEGFSICFYLKLGSLNQASDQDILYDVVNKFGIYYKDGRLAFRITDSADVSYEASYRLASYEESYYVCARYSSGIMNLILNGTSVASSELPRSFKFKSQSSIDLNSTITTGYVIVDKVQIFNYALETSDILNILSEDKIPQDAGQVMVVDDAIYFEPNSNTKPYQSGFSYKTNKNFSEATLEGLEINSSGYVVLSATSGSSSGYLTDKFYFPPLSEDDHNKISWISDSGGVSLEYNTDGGSTYTPLTNNSNISNFNGGDFYYKATITSTDAKNDRPVLENISFVIYDNKSLDSKNSLYQIYTDYNYCVFGYKPVHTHSGYTGLKTIGGGFRIDDINVRSIEFMYRPAAFTDTSLIDCSNSTFSWNSGGTINKTNISSIYVNGQDRTAETLVSNLFTQNVWSHVVIVFNNLKTDDLFFNQTKTGTRLGSDSLFNNIGIYDYDLSSFALKHYNLITRRIPGLAGSDEIDLGSDEFSGYYVDKVVVSTQ